MATKVSSKKATEVKVEAPKQELKSGKFTGIVTSFFQPAPGLRIVNFDTLNASRTRTITFKAALKDDSVYLAGYIKAHTPVEVTCVEIPNTDGIRRFEITSLMSLREKKNLEILRALAE